MTKDDQEKEVFKHVARVNPPWRKTRMTVCGRRENDVKAVVTFDEALAFIKKLGKTRASYSICMICAERCNVRDWWKSPIATLTQGKYNPFGNSVHAENNEFSNELRALGKLYEAHTQEFEELLSVISMGDELAEARKNRKPKPEFRGLTL